MPRHWNRCAAVLLSLCLAVPPVVAAPINQRRQAVISGAMAQVGKTLFYDPAYVQLSYPGGDVPLDRGVCTDVVVRAFRQAGMDLKRLVHEDMRAHFDAYPHRWGLRSTDSNIDHRRVPNLMTFFTRKGHSLPASKESALYQPGDVVAWRLSNGLLHTGVVSDQRSFDGSHYLIVHNIGAGAKVEDVLFAFEIIGHYRYF